MITIFSLEDQARLDELTHQGSAICRQLMRAAEDDARLLEIGIEVRALIAKQQAMLAEIAGVD